MKYTTVRAIMRFIMNIISRVDLRGMENMPEGNFILAANHLGRLDTAILLYAIDREDIIMPIAEKYRNHPLFGMLGRSIHAIWLNRFEADYAALRDILKRMEQGGLMVIAPEGTRSKTEALQEGKMGVAFLASKSGYPVVPVALTGTEDRVVLENIKRFRKSHITATAGKPFYIEIPRGRERDQAMREATDEIMCNLAALLPEKYRGVYAGHPRLKEMLRN
jgi:1-acyl-sn-glycerol-3-phosphate acyltransferase